MSEAQDQSHSHRKRKKKKVEVMMDYIPPKEGFSCPLVGYFPSGFDPEKHKSKGMEEGKAGGGGALKATAYQNTERYKARQHQLVVTPPRGTVDFVGTNYTGESAAWQPGHYALGVFDKDTRTLKLLPIGGAKVLRMEPRVRGLEYNDSTTDVEVTPMSKELKLQQRKLLTSTFGTHKSRIRLSRYERGQVKEEALGDKEQISRLFEKAGDNRTVLTSDEALHQANAAIMRNIPPYDLTAMTPEKAFIFDKIITPEEQASLDVSLLKEMAGNPDKIQEVLEEHTYPEFVLKRLNKLKLQDKGNNKAAIILAYMRHLIVFYHLPRSVMRSINLTNNSNIPSVVWMKLLKHFTTISQESNSEHETRIQTQENRNLLISYILVLGLMVDDFDADPYDLALELRMTISQLRPHYMELGCKFKGVKHTERVAVDENSAQGLYQVVLPVPLKFQTLKAKARRKK